MVACTAAIWISEPKFVKKKKNAHSIWTHNACVYLWRRFFCLFVFFFLFKEKISAEQYYKIYLLFERFYILQCGYNMHRYILLYFVWFIRAINYWIFTWRSRKTVSLKRIQMVPSSLLHYINISLILQYNNIIVGIHISLTHG